MIILFLEIFMHYIFLQIGSDYKSSAAGIYHPTCKEDCPNLCTNEWNGWNNGWYVDNSIKISCDTPPCRCDVYGRFYSMYYDFCLIKKAPCKTLSGDILETIGLKRCGGRYVDCASEGNSLSHRITKTSFLRQYSSLC